MPDYIQQAMQGTPLPSDFDRNYRKLLNAYINVVGKSEIDIVTVDEALDVFKNGLDVGDIGYGNEFLKDDSNGKINSSSIPIAGKNV